MRRFIVGLSCWGSYTALGVLYYISLAQQFCGRRRRPSLLSLWGPHPLSLPFIICTLYEELWQCCVFTDLHLVTCSCTVTCWQSLHFLWYIVAFFEAVNSDERLNNRVFLTSDFVFHVKFSQLNLVNRSHKRVCFWLHILHFAYTGSCWPSQKHWYMVLSHIFVPNDLTLSLLVALHYWKLCLWHAIILCLIKHEEKRLDCEGIFANVVCVQLITEFSFTTLLEFFSFSMPCQRYHLWSSCDIMSIT